MIVGAKSSQVLFSISALSAFILCIFIINLLFVQIIEAELLCRWLYRHAQLISPNQFITKVESNGKIKPITFNLLKQLSINKLLIAHCNKDFYVSINVTLSMLNDPKFIDDVILLIKQNPTLQQGLVFEITERENTTNTFIKLDKIMQRFRTLGVR